MRAAAAAGAPYAGRMEILSTSEKRYVLYRVAEPSADAGPARAAVYLDSSILSYLTSRLSLDITTASRQQATRTWWRDHRYSFDLFVSVRVLDEVGAGDAAAAHMRLRAAAGIDRLDVTEDCDLLTEQLLMHAGLPMKAVVDATHIAIAAVHGMQYLLTWNFKHLANAQISRRVVQTCELSGFRSPKICTPDDLMRAFTHERSDPR